MGKKKRNQKPGQPSKKDEKVVQEQKEEEPAPSTSKMVASGDATSESTKSVQEASSVEEKTMEMAGGVKRKHVAPEKELGALHLQEKKSPAQVSIKGEQVQMMQDFPDLSASVSGRGRSVAGVQQPPPKIKSAVQSPPSNVPQPAVKSKQKEIIKVEVETKPYSSKSLRPMSRPNYGTEGRRIRLRANFFELKVSENVVIYHYDVDVRPEIRSKEKLRSIVDSFVRKNSNTLFAGVITVFDGRKNMYTQKALNLGKILPAKFEHKLEGERENAKPFSIAIQLAAQISLSSLLEFLSKKRTEYPQEAVQALDLVLRETPNHKFIALKQYFFTSPLRSVRLDEPGIEVWSGYFQSVRPGWKCMLVQVDASVRIFHKGDRVVNLCAEFFQCTVEQLKERPMNEGEWTDFQSHIKGLQIEIDTDRYPVLTRRSYKLIGLSKQVAQKQTFPMTQPDGKEVPTIVSKYFETQYKIKLEFPDLHCCQAQPAEKHRYLPMEICVVKKGQQLKKLSDILTAQLIKKSAVPATDREREINNLVKNIDYNNDRVARGFGMSISDRMIEFEGRVLLPPMIEYKNQQKTLVKDGTWQMPTKANFYTTAEVKKMAVLNFHFPFNTSKQPLFKFIDELIYVAKGAGLFLPEPLSLLNGKVASDVEQTLRKLKNSNPELDLVIVILPSQKTNDIYGEVKRIGDLEIGVATQCVQSKNVMSCKPQTLINICYKINAKLGHTNAVVDRSKVTYAMKVPVIVMGADVTHPAPGDTSNPSIAAVTGSFDGKACQYAARISMQMHRQEIIEDLENITEDLLRNFEAKINKKPARIIFYRDGVSEGQFMEVLSAELRAIQRACYRIGTDYKPQITFITVQKRHHTRLFAKDPGDMRGKSCNVPAGTTVDTDIVHPIFFDFYLCSHQGIQGTSRPAHYYVLYDDSNFTADQLQEFTNQLCHVYARCTRSVSIPAPVYYAHHCAFRGRYYLERMGKHGKLPDKDNEAKTFLEALNSRCLIHNNYKGMFFA